MGNGGSSRGGWRPVYAAGLAALALLLPALAGAQEDIVKVGDAPQISNAGMYIAIEKGYYRERGIRNEIAPFASAAKIVAAVTAGEVEVSMGSASAGLFNAIAQGAPFRIVADKGQNRPGYGYTMLSVRKDLLDAGQVRGVKDLKGRKVSVWAKGIIMDYFLGKLAEEVGLSIKDFELVYLSGPNQVTALESKAVDAVVTVEPWGARLEERGLAQRVRTADQMKGPVPVQSGVVMYSGTFIKDRRLVAQRWMEAYLKGCEFYTAKGVQDPEVLAIVEKYTKVPAKVVRGATPFYLGGQVSLASLTDQIQWFTANGFMPMAVPVDQVVDVSFR